MLCLEIGVIKMDRNRARWRDDVVTAVIEIPRVDDDMKPSLFYNKMDYHEFQAAEQRRYDKMMMKQIQKMVQDAMAPQLQEAIDRGATAEELEAMMPQTTEAIFALLGSIPAPAMPAPPKGIEQEVIHHKSAPSVTSNNEVSPPCLPGPDKPLTPADTIISDDDIYALLGVDAGHEETEKKEESSSPSSDTNPVEEPDNDEWGPKESSECDADDADEAVEGSEEQPDPTSSYKSPLELRAESREADHDDDSSSSSSSSSSDSSAGNVDGSERSEEQPDPTGSYKSPLELRAELHEAENDDSSSSSSASSSQSSDSCVANVDGGEGNEEQSDPTSSYKSPLELRSESSHEAENDDSSSSSSNSSADDSDDVKELDSSPEPPTEANMKSDSSLSVEKDIGTQPCDPASHPSLDGSIQDEINEMFGTSISSDIHVQDLLPKSNTEQDRNGTNTSKTQHQLDRWESSDDDDEPLENEAEVLCANEEEKKYSNLEEKLRGSLPKSFLSGPRNTRDSFAISKFKEDAHDETPQPEVPTPEVAERRARNKATLHSNDENTPKVGKTSTSAAEQLWGNAMAKEIKTDRTSNVDSDISVENGLGQEQHGKSPVTRRKLLRAKLQGQVAQVPSPLPPPKSGSDVPTETESTLDARASPKSRRKVPSKSASESGPTSVAKVRRQPRSTSVDGKGGLPTDRERKAGRKPNPPMQRSSSDQNLAKRSNDEEDRKIVIVNGKRLGQDPDKARRKREAAKKKVVHRKDYEVRGGWGNPLDFGAGPTGPSQKAGRKTSAKTETKT